MESMTVDEFMSDYRRKHPEAQTLHAGERFVSASEYAKMYGMSAVAVWEQVKRGLIAGQKFGSRWMVKVVDGAGDIRELERLRSENAQLRLKLKLIQNVMEANESEESS